ncbi:MAG: rod shape-determining protein MreD [Candidatus Azambacteria bacterium]|nr:rod shape-determining protein MreD [Candidatus Azambacteria bacterium]
MISSKNNSKSLWSLLLTILALLFLTALQISFFNPAFFGLNIFLILALILVLAKHNKSALFIGWISGLLLDTARFSNFGENSLVFLITILALIIIFKTAFFTLKTENIIFMALLTVFLYHLLDWVVLNSFALLKLGGFENFGYHFIQWNFPIEIITTVILTLLIFKYFNFYNEQKI